MTTQITVNDSTIEIETQGWGHHEAERNRAVDLLRTALHEHDGELTEDDLRRLSLGAVMEATAGWRCWQPGYYGTTPDLDARLVTATTDADAADLVLCTSPDGWSLHAPGSTDDEIASGDAPYLASGPGRPSATDYAAALAELGRRGRNPYRVGDRIEAPTTDLDGDPATQYGRVVAVDGDDVTVAWDDGARTTQPYSMLQEG